MEEVNINTLEGATELRKIWQAYDLLYNVNKDCTGIHREIYGGPDSFRQKILDSSVLVLLAATKVGEIIGGLAYRAEGDKEILVDFLGVKGPFQGKHVGSKLLQAVISNGTGKIIRLHCKSDSDAFIFYQKKGFQPQWNHKPRPFVKMELHPTHGV